MWPLQPKFSCNTLAVQLLQQCSREKALPLVRCSLQRLSAVRIKQFWKSRQSGADATPSAWPIHGKQECSPSAHARVLWSQPHPMQFFARKPERLMTDRSATPLSLMIASARSSGIPCSVASSARAGGGPEAVGSGMGWARKHFWELHTPLPARCMPARRDRAGHIWWMADSA